MIHEMSEKEFAYTCAKALIRTDVQRSYSLPSIKSGQQGSYNSTYGASIGGLCGSKYYSTDYIVVTRLGDVSVEYVFKLKQVYNSVLDEINSKQTTLV